MSLDQKIQLSIIVLLTGLVIVFIVLIFLTYLIKGYGSVLRAMQSDSNERKASMPAAVGTTVHPSVQTGISEETVAAIAAAVYVLYGVSAERITGIRRSTQPSRSAWGMAGLLESTRPF